MEAGVRLEPQALGTWCGDRSPAPQKGREGLLRMISAPLLFRKWRSGEPSRIFLDFSLGDRYRTGNGVRTYLEVKE